ncbi:hypothetical protein Q5762_03275 [Streptomyces sp. P9(2023)]|uniref:hypothetical protein n=1 Tax=Streptomyces sp. P9(2023) TaxID=3064394 RepID=UPI0028F3F077|nr:hypothetical protein [Streptomyces sp. P9(2023)]MDT9687382.1 hypothetical protein [Streptomyces sp. P9(2023)]
MGEFLSAAAGLPTMLFSAALVVVLGFWLLVLSGVAERGAFDSDVDAERLRLGGVPVAVSVSLVVVIGWALSLSGSVLVHRVGLPGAAASLLSVLLLFLAPFVSWRASRRLVRRLAKFLQKMPRRRARRP